MDVGATWQAALAALAQLSPEHRLLQWVAVPSAAPPACVTQLCADTVIAHAHGHEAVCGGFRWEVALLATAADLALEPLLGQPLGLQLAGPTPRTWYGLCTAVGLTGSDGGLARYTVVIEPFTALLARRRNALIFQDLDVRGIVTRVLADYPLAAFRWEVTQALPVRPITTQYREDDASFLIRLLADAGLAWQFEADAAAPAGHVWVIRDRHAPVPDQGAIRFHRLAISEAEDAIAVFGERQHATPNRRTVASWQTTQVAAPAAHALADAGGLPPLEVFTQPQAGRFPQPAQAQAHADLQLEALRVGRQLHAGAGSARQLAPGTAFTLTQHDRFAGQAFVVLAVEHHCRNNLSAGIAALWAHTQPDPLAEAEYRNRFLAVPLGTPIVPQAPPPVRSPGPQTALVVGLPDAAVTPTRDHHVRLQFWWQRGLAPNLGGLLETGSSTHPDGHAPGDASAGTWVPVAEALAGPNWGSACLPRLGSEVLVEFLHGDLDQPRIVGQLYNGASAPPFALTQTSNHPGTLSGLHSQAHDATGTQQWLLDDATGQLRNRLHTSLADSHLELGYLIHHHNRARGRLRGQGFALATHGWGNVHAAQGLLLSATARPNAVSTQLDVQDTVAQLKAAERTAQALHDTATQQQVPGLTANPQQTALRHAIDPDVDGHYPGPVNGQPATQPDPGSRQGSTPVERFAQPLLLAEGPDRIAFATPASALAYAGANLHLTAQDDAHLAAGQTFAAVSGRHTALLAQTGPLHAIAAHGPVSVHAHAGPLELLADQSVTLTATDGRIDVLAQQKIVLQAGQTQITLDGSNITFECPGEFTVKASQHPFLAGASDAAELDVLPTGVVGAASPALTSGAPAQTGAAISAAGAISAVLAAPPSQPTQSQPVKHWIALDYRDVDLDLPMADTEYEIHFQGGPTLTGALDKQGKARHDGVPDKTVEKVIYKPRPPAPEKPYSPLEELLAAASQRTA